MKHKNKTTKKKPKPKAKPKPKRKPAKKIEPGKRTGKRGRPRRTTEQTRTMTMRLAPAEHDRMRQHAVGLGLELTSWARSVLLAAIGKGKRA